MLPGELSTAVSIDDGLEVDGGVFTSVESVKSSLSSGHPNVSLVFVYTFMESTIVTDDGSMLGPTNKTIMVHNSMSDIKTNT